MIFRLDFKGPYHNVRMRLGNALVVICMAYIYILATFNSSDILD